jgi:RNA polymerase sigma factor (sigma-70 family)
MSSISYLDSRTHLSLLVKLRDEGLRDQAWGVFADKYGGLIYRWCRHWGADHTDAEDITQETLLAVYLRIMRYEHGGRYSFRAWLRKIAKRVWIKILERSLRNKALGSGQPVENEAIQKLISLSARDDLLHRFDDMARDEIRDLVFQRVKSRVAENTWMAYFFNDHEKLSGEEIAARLGMTVGAVHVSAHRVRKLIREELAIVDPF